MDEQTSEGRLSDGTYYAYQLVARGGPVRGADGQLTAQDKVIAEVRFEDGVPVVTVNYPEMWPQLAERRHPEATNG